MKLAHQSWQLFRWHAGPIFFVHCHKLFHVPKQAYVLLCPYECEHRSRFQTLARSLSSVSQKNTWFLAASATQSGLRKTPLGIVPKGYNNFVPVFSCGFIPSYDNKRTSGTNLVSTPNTNFIFRKFEVVELANSFDFVCPTGVIGHIYGCNRSLKFGDALGVFLGQETFCL